MVWVWQTASNKIASKKNVNVAGSVQKKKTFPIAHTNHLCDFTWVPFRGWRNSCSLRILECEMFCRIEIQQKDLHSGPEFGHWLFSRWKTTPQPLNIKIKGHKNFCLKTRPWHRGSKIFKTKIPSQHRQWNNIIESSSFCDVWGGAGETYCNSW